MQNCENFIVSYAMKFSHVMNGIAQVQCHSLLYIKFDEFLPLFMPEKNHMIAGIVTKVLLNPKVQTHWKAFKK